MRFLLRASKGHLKQTNNLTPQNSMISITSHKSSHPTRGSNKKTNKKKLNSYEKKTFHK